MSSISLIISLLKKGRKTTFVCQGNSMFPLIPNNTKITIIPKKFSEIKLYDIVAIKSAEHIVIHQCLFKCSQYLVCHGINNHFIDPPALPNQVLGTVEINNHWSILNLAYDYQLHQIHLLLPKLPILILKGATWQKNYFGYYFNKQSSDIDILIHKSDYPQFKKTLTKLGYSLHQNVSINSRHYHSLDLSEISFSKKINSQTFCLDVHFKAIRSPLNSFFRAPLNPEKMDQLTSEFWNSSYQKNNFYFLKNEYLLLYFCLNSIFHHALRGINLLAQIANIINKEEIDWSNFWNLANEYQLSNFVYYPLGWSSRLFKIKVPHLDQHRPYLLQRFFTKIFINHYAIFRPINNLGKNYLASKINVAIIFVLRLILRQHR